MKVIAKTVNAGKTHEMIEEVVAAAVTGSKVLVITTDMNVSCMFNRIGYVAKEDGVRDLIQPNTIMVREASCAKDVKAIMFDLINEDLDMIAVDCNYAVSRQEWLNLLSNLDQMGYEVIATQQVMHPTQVTL